MPSEMADTSDPDGIQNQVQDQSYDGSDQQELDAERLASQSSVVAAKRVQMDGDGDGAPSYTETSPKRQIGEGHKGEGDSSGHSTPRRDGKSSTTSTPRSASRNPPTPGDLSQVNMTASWNGSNSEGSAKGETENVNTTQGGIGYTVAFKPRAGLLADPAKIAKEREKEERVRQARERLMEERKKKLEELKEQQRIAQENRERQLALRRKKIEDLRRRDSERRQAVEDRRKMKEEIERVRRESILQKAEERLARYEAWKAGGRKGGKGILGVGFGSASPRDICLPFERVRRSSSHTGLQWHSPNSSDVDSHRPQRRALSACSAVRRHYCVDSNPIDRSKTRSRRESKENADGKSSKLTPKDGDTDSGKTEGRKEKKSRSLSFFERLSTPKFQKSSQEPADKSTSPQADTPTVRLSPRKAYSTTNLSMIKKRSSLKERPTFTRDTTPRTRSSVGGKEKDATPKMSLKDKESTNKMSTSKHTPKANSTKDVSSPRSHSTARSSSPAAPKSGSSTPRRVTPPPSANPTPTHSAAPSTAQTEQDGGSTNPQRSHQDITAEEYKARLAEKRRQAREKAEKEAEEERKRLEEERLIEEERQRQEDEEQQRQDEENMRLAAEARQAEEERLQRAIEAEEKRKKDESDRLELEKKQKEEADKKAKEDAEKLEKEKQERAKREEEERLQRKKKLEMIMKRVKPTDAGSDAKSVNGSSQNSPEETSKPITEAPAAPAAPAAEEKVEDQVSDSIPAGMTVSMSQSTELLSDANDKSGSSSPVPRRASSGDILEDSKPVESTDSRMSNSLISTPSRAEDTDSKPKFKSPLLQSLVENKNGGDSNSSPKFKSPLLNSLLGKTKAGARLGLSTSTDNLSSKSGRSSPSSESEKEISNKGVKDQDKDEDTTTNGGLPTSMMADSALGTSIAASMTQSSSVTNGHAENKEGLVDSSISLHSPQTPANGEFEEIIDLIDTAGATKTNGPAPIIAFDQNHRADVTESLS